MLMLKVTDAGHDHYYHLKIDVRPWPRKPATL